MAGIIFQKTRKKSSEAQKLETTIILEMLSGHCLTPWLLQQISCRCWAGQHLSCTGHVWHTCTWSLQPAGQVSATPNPHHRPPTRHFQVSYSTLFLSLAVSYMIAHPFVYGLLPLLVICSGRLTFCYFITNCWPSFSTPKLPNKYILNELILSAIKMSVYLDPVNSVLEIQANKLRKEKSDVNANFCCCRVIGQTSWY